MVDEIWLMVVVVDHWVVVGWSTWSCQVDEWEAATRVRWCGDLVGHHRAGVEKM